MVECIFLAACSSCNIPKTKCLEQIPRNVSGLVTCSCYGEDVLCGRHGNGGVSGGADGSGEEQSAKASRFLSTTQSLENK